MNGINIFFAGPDATKKTTLALRLRDYLIRDKGLEAMEVSFPSPISFASIAISAHKRERTILGPRALTMAYAFDRLDYAEAHLLPIREKKPNMIFVFDRGPLDGGIYAKARAEARNSLDPEGYYEWARSLDSVFNQLFPCHLGFLMSSTIEFSQQVIKQRSLVKEADVFDRDLGWQRISRELFEQVQLGPEWHRINLINPTSDIETDFARIRLIVDSQLSDREGRISRDRE